jgi:hypothetical protein
MSRESIRLGSAKVRHSGRLRSSARFVLFSAAAFDALMAISRLRSGVSAFALAVPPMLPRALFSACARARVLFVWYFFRAFFTIISGYNIALLVRAGLETCYPL